MSIVNCKVKFIRPKYNNLKEWIEDENNIYIARAGVIFINKERFPKKSSSFCNPYKIGNDGTREEVIIKYKYHIEEKLKKDNELVVELLKLKNKNLGCWCYPEPCHGNILLELIEKYDIINKKNGDFLVRRIKDINITQINELNKYDFAKSLIKSCSFNNKNLTIKLKYKKIIDELYKLINNGTQIIKNTKLNIKTTKYETEGFYYLNNLGISVQGVDSNKSILEIMNQCKKNNIQISINILLKNGLIINII